ncbi:MAG: right-handed parallel beta-helix repeat-containing protein [Methanomassiliicoccales archaeon]|nr:MAG: right-handed parallel beta-helix repeat-containing protein [Methanomassiliicoccales archaeon]
MGEVRVNWSSDNESVGTVSTNGSSTTFNAVGIGTCIVTADYGGGINNTTGVLTVAKIDHILIRDSPDNGGNEVGDRFYFLWDYGEVFYAAGYNETYGYLGDVTVTWMSSNDSVGIVGPSPEPSTYFYPVGNGTCTVTANYNGITDVTGLITVSDATLDYIQIRDAPDNGGDLVIDPLYLVGSVDIYYGAMYNHTVGYLWDISAGSPQGPESFWNSSNTSVVTVAEQGTMAIITCNETNEGTALVAVWAYGVTNSTLVTVFNCTIDYINIMDGPGDASNVVEDRIYSVWDTDTFYAIGFNYTYGYVTEVEASWESNDTDFGIVTPSGISSTFTAQWVSIDSTCNVTASYEGLRNTTGNLTVLTPRVDYVQIRSAEGDKGAVISSISYEKGAVDTYYGSTYNHTVGFIGSVPQTSTWNSSNTSIVMLTSPGNSSSITCSDTNWGNVTVILDDGNGHTNITNVTVLYWDVDYILIRDSPSGGGKDLCDPSNYPSYPVGHTTEFYGAMYNYTAGYVGDVASTSNWISSDTSVVEVSSPGVYSTITCSNTNYDVVTVTLNEWMGHANTTQVTVIEPTIDYMEVRDAASGMGVEVGNKLYVIGDTDIFYAAAFNETAGYLDDVPVVWISSNTSVGTVTTFGTSTNFTTVGMGTCIITGYYGAGIMDNTGILTVGLPSNITVDDSGGAHFTSIQEAIDNANDGNTIYVYSGTYFEHITIDKSLIIMGEDMDTTIIDGEGSGRVIYIPGDDISISGFTIQNGEYGIYCDESDSLNIRYNKIRDYTYGIYNHRTTDGYLAYNKITDGEYGIVTYEAYNDAIRYNTISYNTVYGAKDYNSQLKNCFNWNYFHNNHIAYYYDPDTQLAVLEFDGNILEDNYIAIMVENASTISITNNTASRNEYGIYLIRASPYIADNSISTSKYGIYSEDSSPWIENNMISEISEYGIYAKSGDSFMIINNTLLDSEMIFFNSTIKELWLKESTLIKVNTTIEHLHLDDRSSVLTSWFLHIRVVDDEGNPIEGAAVFVYDAFDELISTQFTDSNGWVETILVAEIQEDSTSTISYNPYRIEVFKGSIKNTSELTVTKDTTISIALDSNEAIITPTESPFPWGLIIAVGFIGAIGVSGLCIEIVKYAWLLFFLPLYSRIKKEKLLDQPTRYKIYGYIIGNPGAHFGLIKDDLDLGSGQLVYHIKQLTEAHLIYSRDDGAKKRFYPADIPKPKRAIPNLSDIQEKIFRIIKSNSGIGQKEIASSMGITRQVASYHLTTMERKGLINKQVVGRESRYYPTE